MGHKDVRVFCTTFNRSDLLRKLFTSLAESTVVPVAVHVVDHGRDPQKIAEASLDTGIEDRVLVHTFENAGCAYATNWFLRTYSEERILCADDIQFTPDAIEQMLLTPGDIISPVGLNCDFNAYACYLMRDSCLEKIGYFDENISPGYLYFEDCDYSRRMKLAGLWFTNAPKAGVIHDSGGSNTTKRYTPFQWEDHHRRFHLSMENYTTKWGGLPGGEVFTTPNVLPVCTDRDLLSGMQP